MANQGAQVKFTYTDGQTKAADKPVTVTELPSRINHHWTKALTASADGKHLYVGIGSNSNITERGLDAEENRAMVWEVDAATGAHRAFATGLRNPTALAIHPGTGMLWAVANERDELGPNLVPDYLTSVREGAFYGWPYSYFGQNVDTRVQPQDPDKVVFVQFRDGKPVGEPIDFASGFPYGKGGTMGRPVGVAVDPRGALLIADDLANTIWRVAPKAPTAAAPAVTGSVATPR